MIVRVRGPLSLVIRRPIQEYDLDCGVTFSVRLPGRFFSLRLRWHPKAPERKVDTSRAKGSS
jgi:hypothetical protein